jgi:hypothetical protein
MGSVLVEESCAAAVSVSAAIGTEIGEGLQVEVVKENRRLREGRCWETDEDCLNVARCGRTRLGCERQGGAAPITRRVARNARATRMVMDAVYKIKKRGLFLFSAMLLALLF